MKDRNNSRAKFGQKQGSGGRPKHLVKGQLDTDPIKAKKHLGQHFLIDLDIAERIAETLQGPFKHILEVGPGTGVMTQFLVKRHTPPEQNLWLVDVDAESVQYLQKHYPALTTNTFLDDFLSWNLEKKFPEPVAIVGNFPYNISSQIFFKVLDHVNHVPEIVGMLQKEVAERLVSPPGNKDYGILSVLLQTWYHAEYCFTVHEDVFSPPPKVKSGVVRFWRNERTSLPCDAQKFKQVIKQGFNNRRKTLRNALKGLNLPTELLVLAEANATLNAMLDKRAEQLGVEDFIWLTQQLYPS